MKASYHCFLIVAVVLVLAGRCWADINVDIDVDSDKTGIVEGSDLEESLESNTPAIMMVNNDDDDIDGVEDNMDDDINDPNDSNDLAMLVIRRIPDLPQDYTAFLSVELDPCDPCDPCIIRIFDGIEGEPNVIIDYTVMESCDFSNMIRNAQSDLIFGVEALRYPEVAGEKVIVKLTIYDETEEEYASDTVCFAPAPFLLQSNLEPVEVVYVSTEDASEDPNLYDLIVGALVDPCNPSNFEIVAPASGWIQDHVEIGCSFTPNSNLSVAMTDSNELWPADTLFGANCGYVEIENPVSYFHAGNIEVTPPIIIGETCYEFGRAIIGRKSGVYENILMSNIKNFINAQNMQTPIVECDLRWLETEHIDEVISFIPDDSSSKGFRVLIPDPNLAVDLLRELNVEDSGDDIETYNSSACVMLYSDKNWSKDWTDGFIKMTSGNNNGAVRQIASSGPNTITISSPWDYPDSVVGESYELVARSAYRAMFFEGVEDPNNCGVSSEDDPCDPCTLTDCTKSWNSNEWADGVIIIVEGTGAGQRRWIAGNDTNTITIKIGQNNFQWAIIPDKTSIYILVKTPKKWKPYGNPKPLCCAVRELFVGPGKSYQDEQKFNISEYVESVLCDPCIGLGLSNEPGGDFIRIPALFVNFNTKNFSDNLFFQGSYYTYPDSAGALLPNMVNCLVANNTIVMPKVFSGIVDPCDMDDIFEQYVEGQLGSTGLEVEFVDNFDTFHADGGGVHCATNVKRKPFNSIWVYDCYCLGDTDRDGDVDSNDVSNVVGWYVTYAEGRPKKILSTSPYYNPCMDLDEDGDVDADDVSGIVGWYAVYAEGRPKKIDCPHPYTL